MRVPPEAPINMEVNMKPLISILITNYNKAKYITYILGVLLEHNTDDIEIILIDDCSTDNSIEVIHQILDELNNFKQDNIIIIQHKENKGVAYTKQEALDSSKGEFFIFIEFHFIIKWITFHCSS